jgi:hypothetical protein
MKIPRRPWTENELKRAREMRAAGHFDGEIDKVLGRRAGSTKRRLDSTGYRSGHDVRAKPVPDGLSVEREALAVARTHRTLMQDFFGDPPPGYSALHGKTGLR